MHDEVDEPVVGSQRRGRQDVAAGRDRPLDVDVHVVPSGEEQRDDHAAQTAAVSTRQSLDDLVQLGAVDVDVRLEDPDVGQPPGHR